MKSLKEQKEFLYDLLDKSIELWNELKEEGFKATIEDFADFVKDVYERNYVVEIDMDEIYTDLNTLLEAVEDRLPDRSIDDFVSLLADNPELKDVAVNEFYMDYICSRRRSEKILDAIQEELDTKGIYQVEIRAFGEHLRDIRFYVEDGIVTDLDFCLMAKDDWIAEELVSMTVDELRSDIRELSIRLADEYTIDLL